MHLKYSIVAAVLLSLLTHHALGADALAKRQLQFAFNACERGLQSEKPESQGAFRVLQSLLKKYENNRDNALQKVPQLKDDENERYSGGARLDGKTFAEAFRICESELYERVATDEQHINEKQEKREARQKARQAEVEATLQKINQAKQEVTTALNQNCIQFLRAPTAKSSNLYNNYIAAKNKALAIYPKIVKQFHQITTTDPDTNEPLIETKTVQHWFTLCEEAFAEQGYEKAVATTAEEAVVPPTTTVPPVDAAPANAMSGQITNMAGDQEKPPIVPPATSAEKDQGTEQGVETTDTAEDEEAGTAEEAETTEVTETTEAVEDDTEYQAMLAKVQEDRLKVLKDTGRLPDFSNDEEGVLENATEWQYETEDGSQCTTYVFNKNALAQTKESKGECP